MTDFELVNIIKNAVKNASDNIYKDFPSNPLASVAKIAISYFGCALAEELVKNASKKGYDT